MAAIKKASGARDLIFYVFSLTNSKPDVNQIKMWATMLKRFTEPEDEDLRHYSVSEMKQVIDYLNECGVKPILASHLYYDSIVAYIIDGQLSRARPIIDRMLKEQEGYEKVEGIPSGW